MKLSSVVDLVIVKVPVPAGKLTVTSSSSKKMRSFGVVMPRVGSLRSASVTRLLTRYSFSLASRGYWVEAGRITVKTTSSPSSTQDSAACTPTAGRTPSLSNIEKV